MTANILLARQPIFNSKLAVQGYELLFRPGPPDAAFPACGDSATSQVLLNAFTELPMQDVLEGEKAFVNFTTNLILNPPALNPKQFVIEVLESVAFDSATAAALSRLKAKGYTIALDDFVWTPEAEKIIPLADIIKIDVLMLTPEQVVDQLQHLRGFRGQLLAEKVEDYEMLELCKQQGFTLFQGFFLSKPQIISGRKATENRKAVLDLINVIQNPDIDPNEACKVIGHDPVLSYKLLRVINSPIFAMGHEITSIKHAVDLMGINRLRTWATLLVMANTGDKPHALTVATLNRARFCQQLGAHLDQSRGSGDTYFTAGLFSCIDAMLNTTLDELLPQLSLSRDIKDAITDYDGKLGLAIKTAIGLERAEWETIDWKELGRYDITADDIKQAYLDCLLWTRDLLKTLF